MSLKQSADQPHGRTPQSWIHGHARWYRKGLPSGLRQGRARVL